MVCYSQVSTSATQPTCSENIKNPNIPAYLFPSSSQIPSAHSLPSSTTASQSSQHWRLRAICSPMRDPSSASAAIRTSQIRPSLHLRAKPTIRPSCADGFLHAHGASQRGICCGRGPLLHCGWRGAVWSGALHSPWGSSLKNSGFENSRGVAGRKWALAVLQTHACLCGLFGKLHRKYVVSSD